MTKRHQISINNNAYKILTDTKDKLKSEGKTPSYSDAVYELFKSIGELKQLIKSKDIASNLQILKYGK